VIQSDIPTEVPMSNSPRLLSIIALVLVVLFSLAGCDAATTLPGLAGGTYINWLVWDGVYEAYPTDGELWFIPPKGGTVYCL
jgi:hypothetical protein